MKSYGFRKWVVCFSLNPSQNTPGWLVMRKIELSPFLVIALLWAHNFWLFDFQHYFPEASAGYQRDNRMPCSTDWKSRVLAEGNRANYRRKMYETIIKSHKRTWNEDTTFVATRWSEKCSKTHKNWRVWSSKQLDGWKKQSDKAKLGIERAIVDQKDIHQVQIQSPFLFQYQESSEWTLELLEGQSVQSNPCRSTAKSSQLSS